MWIYDAHILMVCLASSLWDANNENQNVTVKNTSTVHVTYHHKSHHTSFLAAHVVTSLVDHGLLCYLRSVQALCQQMLRPASRKQWRRLLFGQPAALPQEF